MPDDNGGPKQVFKAVQNSESSVSVELNTNNIPILLFAVKLIELEIQKQMVLSQMQAANSKIITEAPRRF